MIAIAPVFTVMPVILVFAVMSLSAIPCRVMMLLVFISVCNYASFSSGVCNDVYSAVVPEMLVFAAVTGISVFAVISVFKVIYISQYELKVITFNTYNQNIGSVCSDTVFTVTPVFLVFAVVPNVC